MPLTVREHMALAVEAQRWNPTYLGEKESHVRETLGWSGTRQAQVVLGLIDRPDAIAEYPVLTARLRRLRDSRRRERRASRRDRAHDHEVRTS